MCHSSVELALVVNDSIFLTHYNLDWRTTPIMLSSCAISSSLEVAMYLAIDSDIFYNYPNPLCPAL